jgi:2-haloacid dehalogenase
MKFSDVRLLSFDCYGTLIDWEFGITDVVMRLAQPHGVHPTEQEILSLFASHETHVQDANPTWTYPVILAETWRRMAESLGLPSRTNQPEQCERDSHTFASSVPTWPAFPDSHQALLDLQGQCKLVILSNVDNASFAGSNARLDVTFDAILTAQDIGSYKPDVRNFHVLLDRARAMGVGPEQHLHVAQSLFHDHVPAQSVGLKTVWINRYGAKRAATGSSNGTAKAHSAGATPAAAPVNPHWEYPTLRAFADALLSR